MYERFYWACLLSVLHFSDLKFEAEVNCDKRPLEKSNQLVFFLKFFVFVYGKIFEATMWIQTKTDCHLFKIVSLFCGFWKKKQCWSFVNSYCVCIVFIYLCFYLLFVICFFVWAFEEKYGTFTVVLFVYSDEFWNLKTAFLIKNCVPYRMYHIPDFKRRKFFYL